MATENRGRSRGQTPKTKRAITLGGGGPVAGFHIGILLKLDQVNDGRRKSGLEPIEFDVWALSCIGAWVGVVYHSFAEDRAQQTYEFFKEYIFRDDSSYGKFPINRAFGPDSRAWLTAWLSHLAKPGNYIDPLDIREMVKSVTATVEFMMNPQAWRNEGDRNYWFFNNILAVNPVVRFVTALAFKSQITGLTKIYYEGSTFLGKLFDEQEKMKRSAKSGFPEVYLNAWNLGSGKIQLFHSDRERVPTAHRDKFMDLTAKSLCACSALPYIEETVEIDGQTYCEGALVDTVNFKDLVEIWGDDLDEIWISRIVHKEQVGAPQNLTDALGNLCQLFAAEVGENDIKLFRQHLRKQCSSPPRVVELNSPESHEMNFDWSHANLEKGIAAGTAAFEQTRLRLGL